MRGDHRDVCITRFIVQEFLLRKILLLAGLVACSQGWALAQTPTTTAPYRSAFEPGLYPAPTNTKPTDWAQANAEAGRNLRGHMDILKWEAANSPTPAEPGTQAALLWPAQAVQLAMQGQPELFVTITMGAMERAETNAGVLKLAHSVYRAWTDAVAARQSLGYLRDVHEAAQTATELARRMASVGNWSKAQWMQEQLLASAAATQVAAAQQRAFSAEENLIRLLGLSNPAASIQLPARLPELPNAPQEISDLEETALRHKPAFAAAQTNARLERANLAEEDLRSWQQAMNHALKPSDADPALPAQALDTLPRTAPLLILPRTTQNSAVERAIQAQARANAVAVATRSQAREAYYRYRTAWDTARHQQDVVRLNTALQDETQLRYNDMLLSTWDLLASARARVQSVNDALQAQRDFWLAHTDLQMVLAGGDVSFAAESSNAGTGLDAPKGH